MDKSGFKLTATLVVALLIGMGIGYIDTRPTWDDTGVTVGALLVAGALAGVAAPRRFWLSGLALGLPVLIMNIGAHGNYGAALAVAASIAGAGLGALSRKFFLTDGHSR